MAVIVKRYRVRHDEKLYGPGDVITGLSKKEEARLISESNGSIEPYKVVKTEEEPADEEEEEIVDPDMGGIASLNADDLIKPARKK